MSNPLLEMLKKKRAQMAAGNNDWRPYKPKNGKTIIRILPPWRPAGVEGSEYQFFHDFGQHWIKGGADNRILSIYTCPEKSMSQECEVCGAIGGAVNYAKQLGDEELEKAIKESNAQQQYLINVLVLNHEDTAMRNVPITMTVGKTVLEQIASLMETFMLEAEITLYDLKTGVNLVIERTGSGFDTKYMVVASPKGSSECPAIKGEVPNLDDIVAAQLATNNEAKSLNAVAKAAGLQLPAPGTPAAAPGLSSPSAQTLLEEAAEAEFEELEAEIAATTASKPPNASAAPATSTAPVVAEAVLDADAELDAMLAEFETAA